MYHTRATALLSLTLLAACAGAEDRPPVPDESPDANTPQDAFWAALQDLCGDSFEGRVVESEPPDPSFDTQQLVMHVRSCTADSIRIPFHVGDDRSRTWVVTRTVTGLRLKHDHRHEDGSEDAVTQYGGDTRDAGTGAVQEFPADAFTAELLPVSATNVWTLELRPGEVFRYVLRREGAERRFRAEFDLRQPVDTPPPPWGG